MKRSEKNEFIAKSAVVLVQKVWDILHSGKVVWTYDNLSEFKETLWVINEIVEGEKGFQRFINNLKEEES